MSNSEYMSGDGDSGGVTRRTVIGRAVGGAVGLSVMGGVLSACGSSASTGNKLQSSSGNGTPKRGGTITLGTITSGASATLNPLLSFLPADFFLAWNVYDFLFINSPDGKTLTPRLAVSAEHNADATVWTIKLRDGVTWHDGKPFTADDVIYSLKLWRNPVLYQHFVTTYIDYSRLRKRDRLTVEIPLVRPVAAWPSFFSGFTFEIVQDGSTFAKLSKQPNGTGPFKFVSSKAGVSVADANKNYWESGKPYIDRLVINSTFQDESARLDALLSGEIDVAPLSPFVQTKRYLTPSSGVMAIGSPASQPWGDLIMRVDKGPLADARVRRAMMLIADRQALIDGAYAGFGAIGNDLLGDGQTYFASDLKREQDIEQAKSLLKAAGREGATFTLNTSAFDDGVVQAATLFAEQAKAAGITVNLKQTAPGIYFTPSGGLLTGSFRQELISPPLNSLALNYLWWLSGRSTFNETHWGSQPGGSASLALIDQAVGELDPNRAQQMWHELQLQQHNNGGNVIFGLAYSLSLVRTHVKGLRETRASLLNWGRVADGWVA